MTRPGTSTESTHHAGPSGPRVTVRLPGALRPLAGGAGRLEVAGGTVAEVLAELVRRHPGLGRHLRTESGSVREHVNVFLDEEDIRYLDGMATPVADGQELFIIPSIAGG